jgi:ADP-L-glycero-D-manno-heptose 6-epimerase
MPTGPIYIVTGGAGFIGSNLCAALIGHDPSCHVIAVDDLRTGSFANIVEACDRHGVGPFTGAVMADDHREEVVGLVHTDPRPAAVFHLGAITDTTVADEREMIGANASWGFEDMLQACALRDVPLVYASSAATYGTPPQAARREPFPVSAAGRPNNVYGFSKWLMECAHRRLDGARVAVGRPRPWIVGLRYFNVFGPGESTKGHMASMARQLTTQMLAGRSPRLFIDGEQARDQVHVDDVVACTMAGAGLGSRKDPEPGVYNLGSGRATTFNEIVAAIRRGLGVDDDELPTEYFEMPRKVRAFYQDYTCADMSETKRGLGFEPRHDPVEATAGYAAYLRDRTASPEHAP